MKKKQSHFQSIRHKLQLSQEEFAGYLGIDRSMLSRFENSERSLNTDSFQKLAMLVEKMESNTVATKSKDVQGSLGQSSMRIKMIEDLIRKQELQLNKKRQNYEKLESTYIVATQLLSAFSEIDLEKHPNTKESSALSFEFILSKYKINSGMANEKKLHDLHISIICLKASIRALKNELKSLG